MNTINNHSVFMFGLSTCGYCKRARLLLEGLGVELTVTYVDLLSGSEREDALYEMSKYNPEISFPTTIIDNKEVIIGDDEVRIKELLGEAEETDDSYHWDKDTSQRESIETLRAHLSAAQEKKGYFFNNYPLLVDELLWQLMVNKSRYEYMLCPCRLTAGSREKDADVICPCAYRAQDVAEYGSCYCGLYVSEELKDAPYTRIRVPERRPANKRQYILSNKTGKTKR